MPQTVKDANEKTRIQVAQELFAEFCANSTIHGVRYFVDKRRHWTERILWALAFVSSACLCAYIVFVIYMENRMNPISVRLDNILWPSSSIPFPAVTICSTKKIDKKYFEKAEYARAVMDFEHFNKYLSPEDLNRLDAMLQVCHKQGVEFKNSSDFLRTEPIYRTIENMNPNANSVVQASFFNNHIIHFKPIFTEDGLCFTFNSLDSQHIFSDEVAPELITVRNDRNELNWDMENGYTRGVEKVYPHRVLGSGLQSGLRAMLSTTADETDRYCFPISPSFRIALHTPDTLPQFPDDFAFIPIDHEIYIQVDPKMITTTKHLKRTHSSEMRDCVFKSERKLRFFKFYNMHNCQMECWANFTNSKCGCVKFFMPRDKNTKVCTVADLRCYINARQAFVKKFNGFECNCVRDCFAIAYDFNILQVMNYPAVVGVGNMSSINANSELFISFQRNSFVPLRFNAAQTLFDFIANCGGLLNLFMGISMLSVIELIYYFSVYLMEELKQLRLLRSCTWLKQKYSALKKIVIKIR